MTRTTTTVRISGIDNCTGLPCIPGAAELAADAPPAKRWPEQQLASGGVTLVEPVDAVRDQRYPSENMREAEREVVERLIRLHPALRVIRCPARPGRLCSPTFSARADKALDVPIPDGPDFATLRRYAKRIEIVWRPDSFSDLNVAADALYEHLCRTEAASGSVVPALVKLAMLRKSKGDIAGAQEALARASAHPACSPEWRRRIDSTMAMISDG